MQIVTTCFSHPSTSTLSIPYRPYRPHTTGTLPAPTFSRSPSDNLGRDTPESGKESCDRGSELIAYVYPMTNTVTSTVPKEASERHSIHLIAG
jgi:hypothetical protein